jgi:para-aminobenzoate synthetase component 1
MRNTASFPAGDKQLLKRKLIHWAGNFSAGICFDRNAYSSLNNGYDFIAGVGISAMADTGAETFGALRAFTEGSKEWIFGFLSYDLKNEIEPTVFKRQDLRPDGVGFASSFFYIPEIFLAIRNDTLIIESNDDPCRIYKSIMKTDSAMGRFRPAFIQSRTGQAIYLKAVQELKEHIAAGDLYEVNYCQEFFAENFSADPYSLFGLLNELSTAPFACFVKHRNRYLLCASPERFIQKTGRRIFSQPMKGTIGRSRDPVEDDRLRMKLTNDQKERAENVMIVDLVRNDLAKSAVPGSIRADELFGIHTFPRVHQMVSTVSATLRDDVHFTDAIRNAFPMGSMTGAPKVMAMQLIDEYEPVKRGLFSGSVGFISPEGDFDFNVVIRSILYNADDRYLSFQAGSAITYASDPFKEYEECMLKVESLKQAVLSP